MFVLFLNWDLKYTGLVMNLWAGALRSMGDHSESLVVIKTHNEKASTAQDSALAVGVKRDNIPTTTQSHSSEFMSWCLGYVP